MTDVFEGRWPITDEDMPVKELCAVARPEFFAMAARKRLMLMPETVTWEVRDRPRGRGLELVYRAEAVRLDDVASVALGKRGAA